MGNPKISEQTESIHGLKVITTRPVLPEAEFTAAEQEAVSRIIACLSHAAGQGGG